MRMKYCSGSAANRSGVGPLMPGILARYRRRVPRRMDDAEWRAFVSEGTTEATEEPKVNGRALAIVGAVVVLIAVIAAILVF